MVKTIDILGFPHAYELSAPTDSSVVLVFVHGWLLSRAFWQPVIQRLAPHHQCLTYDLRGFGASQYQAPAKLTEGDAVAPPALTEPIAVGAGGIHSGASSAEKDLDFSTLEAAPPKSRFSLEDYAQDLNLLLKALGIKKAWLVGHSLGGSIALWAADQAPETIAGVICINSGGGIYLKEEFERFRTAGEQLIRYRPRWISLLPFVDLALTRMNVARPIARRWGRQRLLDLTIANTEAALGVLLDSTTETEVHRLPQVVARLQQPVYFIAGADDTVMEPKYVNHLASFHALFDCCGHNVVEIPNCGHLAMVEQPEAVTQEIQAIVSKYES